MVLGGLRSNSQADTAVDDVVGDEVHIVHETVQIAIGPDFVYYVGLHFLVVSSWASTHDEQAALVKALADLQVAFENHTARVAALFDTEANYGADLGTVGGIFGAEDFDGTMSIAGPEIHGARFLDLEASGRWE